MSSFSHLGYSPPEGRAILDACKATCDLCDTRDALELSKGVGKHYKGALPLFTFRGVQSCCENLDRYDDLRLLSSILIAFVLLFCFNVGRPVKAVVHPDQHRVDLQKVDTVLANDEAKGIEDNDDAKGQSATAVKGARGKAPAGLQSPTGVLPENKGRGLLHTSISAVSKDSSVQASTPERRQRVSSAENQF